MTRDTPTPSGSAHFGTPRHGPWLAGALGACVVVVAACTPAPPPMDVSATAYCIQGITKSGTETRKGIIAADPRVLPLGSIVEVDGLDDPLNGIYTVTDTGSAIKGPRIDIFMENCRAARQFGRQDAKVRLLERGSADDDPES